MSSGDYAISVPKLIPVRNIFSYIVYVFENVYEWLFSKYLLNCYGGAFALCWSSCLVLPCVDENLAICQGVVNFAVLWCGQRT